MTFYSSYVTSMHRALAGLEVTDRSRAAVPAERAFETWTSWTNELKASRGTCYFAGNGASATMASHFAIDGTKNAGVNSLAFNDIASLTAIGNDLGYDETFAFPLRRFARPGDLLVTISSSGNSPNILRAIAAARELGLRLITLSGMKPDNQSRGQGDLNFYIPARTYGIVESSHAVVLHCWLDHMMGTREEKS